MSNRTHTPTAAITGAASGIGLATARALAAKGWRLALADLDEARLAEVAAELAPVTEVLTVRVDVSNGADVQMFADTSYDRFDRLDFVYSNAGVALMSPILDTTINDWEWLLGVNVWGTINCVNAFGPRLVEQEGRSHLTFTASISGVVPAPGLGAYGASKYAVVGIAEVLYRELRDREVGVSVLCPMRVATNFATSGNYRPDRFGSGSGAHEVKKENNGGRRFVGDVLSPDVVADMVVDAIGTDTLYIFTHAESAEWVRRRNEKIDAGLAQAQERSPQPN